MVEFAIVFPMLVVLFLAIFEFVLVLNASMAVSRASQHGAHVAASAGNTIGADCLILDAVERNLEAPNDPGRIREIRIERSPPTGDGWYSRQVYRRGGGPTSCTYPDGATVSVPYALAENGYRDLDRCSVLAGCPSLGRTTVDNIGVTVEYHHDWVTPLNSAIDLVAGSGGGSSGSSSGWDFEQRNIFRMEPSL